MITNNIILFNNTIVVGALFLIGLILVLFAKGRNKKENHSRGLGELWLRFICFLFIVPIFLIPAYIGSPFFNVIIVGMSIFFIKEFIFLAKIEYNKIYFSESIFFVFLILLATIIRNKLFFLCIPVIVISVIMLTPVLLQQSHGAIKSMSITIIAVLYFGWMFNFSVLLRNDFGFSGLFFICILATISDLASFWTGKYFGKKKLAPIISPNKTIAGAVGGIIITAVFGLILKYNLPMYSHLTCMAFGMIISLLAQVGDLSLSAIKRDMQVKDFGALLPGHGGMLDRFDSWTYTLPIMFFLLTFFK